MPSQAGALSPLVSRTHLGAWCQRGPLGGSWAFGGTRLGCPEHGEKQGGRDPASVHMQPLSGLNPLQPLERRVWWRLGPIRGGEGRWISLREAIGAGGRGTSILTGPQGSPGERSRARRCAWWEVGGRWLGLQVVALTSAAEGAGSREAGTCIGSWAP